MGLLNQCSNIKLPLFKFCEETVIFK